MTGYAIIENNKYKEVYFMVSLKRLAKIGLVALIAIGLFFFLLLNGVIVFDRSAVLNSEELYWNGNTYISCSGIHSEGKTIAKTADGKWNINEIKEDPSHTFIVVRSFLDDSLYVRKDYQIPQSGDADIVYLDGNKIDDESFLDAVSQIYFSNEETVEHTTNDIHLKTDTQDMRAVYVGFNDCPVAVFMGYIGKIDGEWVIITDLSALKENDDGSGTPYKIECQKINQKHIQILENHFN